MGTDNSHLKLREGADGVVKNIHRFLRPYVRFNAIGRKNGTPHSHYCVQADKVRYLKEYTTDIEYKSGAKFGCKNGGVIYNAYGLLSYLFYQNFVPTFLDPNRIKRFRLITGSRFASWGHPAYKKERDWHWWMQAPGIAKYAVSLYQLLALTRRVA